MLLSTTFTFFRPPPICGEVGGLHCNYCGKDGHVKAFCSKKKAHKAQTHRCLQIASSASTRGSQVSSADSITKEMLMLLPRLVASSMPGAASKKKYQNQEFMHEYLKWIWKVVFK